MSLLSAKAQAKLSTSLNILNEHYGVFNVKHSIRIKSIFTLTHDLSKLLNSHSIVAETSFYDIEGIKNFLVILPIFIKSCFHTRSKDLFSKSLFQAERLSNFSNNLVYCYILAYISLNSF